jgi:hypothetical protein
MALRHGSDAASPGGSRFAEMFLAPTRLINPASRVGRIDHGKRLSLRAYISREGCPAVSFGAVPGCAVERHGTSRGIRVKSRRPGAKR